MTDQPADEFPRFTVGNVRPTEDRPETHADHCSQHGDIPGTESIDGHALKEHGASSAAIRKARKTVKMLAALPPSPAQPTTANVEALTEALVWAMAPNERYQGRHRTEPRCRVFMPTDGTCNCGYEEASVALHAALRATPTTPNAEALRVLTYLDEQVRYSGDGRFLLREPLADLDAGDQDAPERAVLMIRAALRSPAIPQPE